MADGKVGMDKRCSGNRGLTGIELLAIGLESAPVMDEDRVSFLRLPFALYGECDIDLQVV
jgi:hypothetical protein